MTTRPVPVPLKKQKRPILWNLSYKLLKRPKNPVTGSRLEYTTFMKVLFGGGVKMIRKPESNKLQ